MRHFVMTALTAAFAAQSQAVTLNFQDVTARYCDGVQQKIKTGDRIAYQSEGYLIIAETLPNGCKIADFHTVFVTGWTKNDDRKATNLALAPIPVQRKNSCSTQLQKVESHFQSAVYSGDRLVLKGGRECATLELELSKP